MSAWNPGVEHLRVLDLGIKKLSTKILGCLPDDPDIQQDKS